MSPCPPRTGATARATGRPHAATDCRRGRRRTDSFAIGTLGGATVVVSEGLLSALDGDELDAVLAHELTHVADRDATV